MHLPAQSVQVWVLRLPSRKASLDGLSPGELSHGENFQLQADRHRFLATRAALRCLLGRYLQSPPASFSFSTNPHGKPVLAGDAIQFNVSHSGNFALLAFARQIAVGVDVEEIKNESILHEIATPAEIARLQSLPETARGPAFFQLWTEKEAALKAFGTGLSADLAAFGPTTYSVRRIDLGDPRYAAAVAAVAPHFDLEVRNFEFE